MCFLTFLSNSPTNEDGKSQQQTEFEKIERRKARARERVRHWRQQNPDRHRQNSLRWAKSERGRKYKAAYMREWRRRQRVKGDKDKVDTTGVVEYTI